jgi:pimeloyl-ACP methyl ester carboxylesterase
MQLGNMKKEESEMPGSKFIQTENGRISYDDTGGKGRTVICLPGMGDLRTVYRFITVELEKKGFRVITMDLRGMGDSKVKWNDYSESSIALDIISIINQLELKSVILMGNSISGGATLIASTQHPELISSMVLISPFARNVPISRLKLILFRLALAGPWGMSAWISYMSSKLYPSVKPPDMDKYKISLKNMLQQKGRMRAFRKMAATNHDKAEECLKKISVPTLIVMGSRDPDFPDPVKEAEWLAEQTGAKHVIIEGAGHYPQAEFPEKFMEHITDFLGDRNA